MLFNTQVPHLLFLVQLPLHLLQPTRARARRRRLYLGQVEQHHYIMWLDSEPSIDTSIADAEQASGHKGWTRQNDASCMQLHTPLLALRTALVMVQPRLDALLAIDVSTPGWHAIRRSVCHQAPGDVMVCAATLCVYATGCTLHLPKSCSPVLARSENGLHADDA